MVQAKRRVSASGPPSTTSFDGPLLAVTTNCLAQGGEKRDLRPETAGIWRMSVELRPERNPDRRNNFDALRISAALSVLISHAVPLTEGPRIPQPLVVLSRGQTDLGSVAVLVFFVISGYLVTQSFDRAPVAQRFLKARCLRIFPALFVALVLTAVLLGPTFTTLSIRAYFFDPDSVRYVLGNASLLHIRYHPAGRVRKQPDPFDRERFYLDAPVRVPDVSWRARPRQAEAAQATCRAGTPGNRARLELAVGWRTLRVIRRAIPGRCHVISLAGSHPA